MGVFLSLFLALLKIGNALLKRASDEKLRKAGWDEATVAGFRAFMTIMEKANAIDRVLLDDDADPEWVRRVRDRASGKRGNSDPDSPGFDGATPDPPE